MTCLNDKVELDNLLSLLDCELVWITFNPMKKEGGKLCIDEDTEITFMGTKDEELMPEDVVEELAFSRKELFPPMADVLVVFDSEEGRFRFIKYEQVVHYEVVMWSLTEKVEKNDGEEVR